MSSKCIDTNIFLRYLTQSDPAKIKACYALFKRAVRHEITITTSEVVIAKVVMVLSSRRHYQLSRKAIKHRLYPLLCLRGLNLPHLKTCLRALDYYTQQAPDFENCLTLAHMELQRLSELYSYDQDFDHVQRVKRRGPRGRGKNELRKNYRTLAREIGSNLVVFGGMLLALLKVQNSNRIHIKLMTFVTV